jgi:hypothetical protein
MTACTRRQAGAAGGLSAEQIKAMIATCVACHQKKDAASPAAAIEGKNAAARDADGGQQGAVGRAACMLRHCGPALTGVSAQPGCRAFALAEGGLARQRATRNTTGLAAAFGLGYIPAALDQTFNRKTNSLADARPCASQFSKIPPRAILGRWRCCDPSSNCFADGSAFANA